MKFAFVLPFVAAADVPLTMSWDEWKNHFGMTFNGEEDAARGSVFEANIAFIESENAKDNTYTLGVNHFSHLSEDEFIAQFTGGQDGSAIGSDDAHMGVLEIGERASTVDWTTQAGVVNPVKDQGQCGSCWAFSAVGTVESGYALAAGKLSSYSEQQLVDCDTSRSQGCSGGFNQYGIQYIGQTGSCSESAYPYKAADGTCTASSCSKALAAGTVTGYNSVTASTAGLDSALNAQPVSVTMKADNTWQSYRSGDLQLSIKNLTGYQEKTNCDTLHADHSDAELEEDISTWNGDMNAATAVPNQEKTDYDTIHADYSDSLMLWSGQSPF